MRSFSANSAAVTGALAFIAFTAGCVSTAETTSSEALVCPQCRSVAVEAATMRIRSHFPYSRRAGASHVTACSGCKGVLESFVSEGAWKHKCSICARTPFRCPVLSDTSSRTQRASKFGVPCGPGCPRKIIVTSGESKTNHI